jgi:hypothetical protein
MAGGIPRLNAGAITRRSGSNFESKTLKIFTAPRTANVSYRRVIRPKGEDINSQQGVSNSLPGA